MYRDNLEVDLKQVLKEIREKFSLQDKKILLAFKQQPHTLTTSLLVETLKMDRSAVVRGLLRLQKYGIITLHKERIKKAKLTGEGIKYAETHLPEKKLLEHLKKIGGEASLDELKNFLDQNTVELNRSLGWLKRKGLIEIVKRNNEPFVRLKNGGSEFLPFFPEETVLKTLWRKGTWVELPLGIKNEEELIKTLKRRNLLVTKEVVEERAELTSFGKELLNYEIPLKITVSNLTPGLIETGKWREVTLKKYDVYAPVAPTAVGRLHPTLSIADKIREIWFDMGFTEAIGPIVELAFWCFDALYQPQDHPARELADTLYIKNIETKKMPPRQLIKKVKETHENGWVTGSSGWRYKWSLSEAKKIVLRTHTTSVSARFLTKIKPPAKIFSIGKVFRRENLDPTHLHEFYQVEGIVVSESVTFRDLLGYLNEYFSRLGFTKTRYRPGYFPYTELSVEPEVYDPERGEWIELGGAGIFRPEVVVPLLGKDIPVLAWGLGLDRLTMRKYNLGDIRFPYFNDIKWLRTYPI